MNIFSHTATDPRGEVVDVWTFVPLDPEDNALENDEGFDEAFAGALMGMVLGGFGLEHLAHALEGAARWGEFQDALRPQPSAVAVRQAISQWRASGRSFAQGELRGVWVATPVRRARLSAAFSFAMRPAPAPTTRHGHVAPGPAPELVRSYDRPRYRLRPPW